MIKITNITVVDIRFPTSKDQTGSDAIHKDPNYSAAYIVISTSDNNHKGYGITFTGGKGNDIVENGNYMRPLDHGYSIEMKEKSVNTFSFPNGEYWIRNT